MQGDSHHCFAQIRPYWFCCWIYPHLLCLKSTQLLLLSFSVIMLYFPSSIYFFFLFLIQFTFKLCFYISSGFLVDNSELSCVFWSTLIISYLLTGTFGSLKFKLIAGIAGLASTISVGAFYLLSLFFAPIFVICLFFPFCCFNWAFHMIPFSLPSSHIGYTSFLLTF